MCSAVVPLDPLPAAVHPAHAAPGRGAPQPLVRLSQAGVHFGALLALRDVNLTLHRGERLMLVGANGSGKTTLLRALHGLVPLSSGQRTLGAGRQQPRIAMLFQRPF
ncbi:MAG TPA: ATP-binding cassette domain-containing protein, partial [Burkholderiaceae bacterium]